MASPGSIEIQAEQSPNAIESYSVRHDPDLPVGASVAASGHRVTHTPAPGGTATTPTIAISGNTSTTLIGPLLTSGLHKIEVDIDYDNSGGVSQGIVFWITVP